MFNLFRKSSYSLLTQKKRHPGLYWINKNKETEKTSSVQKESLISLSHRWCYVNVHVVANTEFGLMESLRIISTFSAWACNTNLSHSVLTSFGVDEGKVKICTFSTCFRIYIPYECSQFAQRCILPGIYLQFIAGYIPMGIFGSGMVSSGGTKDSQ